MTQDPIYASQARPWLKYYDQKYIEQTIPTVSAFEYVCQRNKNHLNDTALDYYGRKFTYADLIVNVKKTAAALRGVGVQKGDFSSCNLGEVVAVHEVEEALQNPHL